MRINKEYKKPLKDGRLLFLSPFDENQRRISARSSYYRNLFVVAMSAVIFVAHASPSNKTEAFCKEILTWQKPIYTFDSDYNKNLVEIGARPIKMDNVSGRAKFMRHIKIANMLERVAYLPRDVTLSFPIPLGFPEQELKAGLHAKGKTKKKQKADASEQMKLF